MRNIFLLFLLIFPLDVLSQDLYLECVTKKYSFINYHKDVQVNESSVYGREVNYKDKLIINVKNKSMEIINKEPSDLYGFKNLSDFKEKVTIKYNKFEFVRSYKVQLYPTHKYSDQYYINRLNGDFSFKNTEYLGENKLYNKVVRIFKGNCNKLDQKF